MQSSHKLIFIEALLNSVCVCVLFTGKRAYNLHNLHKADGETQSKLQYCET